MRFGVNWNNGYEVGVTMVSENGMMKYHPLRNFGERQGDAMIFKEVDCPKLTEKQLRLLIKKYNPKVRYIRCTGGHRFIKNENGCKKIKYKVMSKLFKEMLPIESINRSKEQAQAKTSGGDK